MSQASRTFRVFEPSTFSDLPVDLHWGVREEAGLDHRVMRICLDELARCQRG